MFQSKFPFKDSRVLILPSLAHTAYLVTFNVSYPSICVINNPVNMPAMICFQSRLAGKHWPEADLMILANQLASRPDPFGQNLTRPSR